VAPHGRQVIRTAYPEEAAPQLDAGAEMGRFLLGSTVILLFEPGKIEWVADLRAGDIVRMGQVLGRKIAQD
jgi:phosphatidylserine decarboxylase